MDNEDGRDGEGYEDDDSDTEEANERDPRRNLNAGGVILNAVVEIKQTRRHLYRTLLARIYIGLKGGIHTVVIVPLDSQGNEIK